jgi:nicotinamide-nucleotide amidase
LAVTGIAGPTGGTPEKPVGLVWLAVSDAQGAVSRQRRFGGTREVNKDWAAQMALDLLRRRLLHVE